MQRPEPADAGLLDYYRRRAWQYEAVYAKPERQADLARLRKDLPKHFKDARVLEIACGTGYWTGVIAQAAKSVLATDLAEEPMLIAQSKPYPGANVRFACADAYALPAQLGRFDAAFAGFWWSHVPRERIGAFLSSVHARLERGAKVVLLDNRFVSSSSTPALGDADAQGNTYQLRKLEDGSQWRVLKNFPAEEALREMLAPHASAISYHELEYYWLLEYRLK